MSRSSAMGFQMSKTAIPKVQMAKINSQYLSLHNPKGPRIPSSRLERFAVEKGPKIPKGNYPLGRRK